MSSPGFLLDENVPLALQAQLRRREPTIQVSVVGQVDAPPKAAPDSELLYWIEERGCLLVTNNRATMPVHLRGHLAAGRHVPGILILPSPLDLGTVLEDLLLIWAVGRPDEFQDRISYLPLRESPSPCFLDPRLSKKVLSSTCLADSSTTSRRTTENGAPRSSSRYRIGP